MTHPVSQHATNAFPASHLIDLRSDLVPGSDDVLLPAVDAAGQDEEEDVAGFEGELQSSCVEDGVGLLRGLSRGRQVWLV